MSRWPLCLWANALNCLHFLRLEKGGCASWEGVRVGIVRACGFGRTRTPLHNGIRAGAGRAGRILLLPEARRELSKSGEGCEFVFELRAAWNL